MVSISKQISCQLSETNVVSALCLLPPASFLSVSLEFSSSLYTKKSYQAQHFNHNVTWDRVGGCAPDAMTSAMGVERKAWPWLCLLSFIHMGRHTYELEHVLGILIGSQKQESFRHLPRLFSFSPSPPTRDSLSLSPFHNRVLRAVPHGAGAVHIVRLLPVFLRILVSLFFRPPPGANCDSTSRLRA